MKQIIILSLIGLTAGIVNGLFSTGGGSIALIGLSVFLMKKKPGEEQTKALFATINALIIILSAASAITLFLIDGDSTFDFSGERSLTLVILTALAGSAAGVYLLGKIRPQLLKRLFGIMIIYCGVRMLL